MDDGWVLGAEDNGIGVPEKHRAAVFAPFKRLHTRAEYEGSGIGLAFFRKCVERHGGAVWLEPAREGSGSYFKFSLPDREI